MMEKYELGTLPRCIDSRKQRADLDYTDLTGDLDYYIGILVGRHDVGAERFDYC